MKNYFFLFLFLYGTPVTAWNLNFFSPKKPFLLFLEAAGDSRTVGRIIDTQFESSVCLELAQTIQRFYNDKTSSLFECLVNRTPGQTLALYANQQYANKLSIDLYVSVNAYFSPEKTPSVTIYRFSYNDPIILTDKNISFIPFDTIYLINESSSTRMALQFKEYLNTSAHLEVDGPYALPFNPLIGIKSAAFGIEVSGNSDTNLEELASIIADGLRRISS